jgi:hypothetical protein
VAETTYACAIDTSEVLTITICVPGVTFNEEKLLSQFGQFNNEKQNFVADLKNFVISHDLTALRKKLEVSGGKLKLKLNGTEVVLVYKEDFFLNANEKHLAQ